VAGGDVRSRVLSARAKGAWGTGACDMVQVQLGKKLVMKRAISRGVRGLDMPPWAMPPCTLFWSHTQLFSRPSSIERSERTPRAAAIFRGLLLFR